LRETESSATILHVALLYNHPAIVDFLLSNGDRDLMLAKYETGEYRNQTSLHVAVANGNLTIVEQLMTSLDNEVFCCADIKRYDINCVQASLKSAKNVHNGCI